MAKSKPFIAAVEGATATDGRVIEASWIRDIVATYTPKTYGARINLEHIRGYSPEPPFNAYGDVLSATYKTIDLSIGGKTEKRLALELVVEGQPSLVELSKKKQKAYPSIEVAPNFANSGKAYLVGLAFTDSPASIGTEMLQFSTKDDPAAKAVKAMFDGRKQDPGNVFSSAHETTLEWEDGAAPAGDIEDKFSKALASFGDKIMASFGIKQDPPAPANDPVDGKFDAAAFSKAMKDGLAPIVEQFAAATQASDAKFNTLQSDLNELKTKLEGKPAPRFTSRPPATGGSGQVQADF